MAPFGFTGLRDDAAALNRGNGRQARQPHFKGLVSRFEFGGLRFRQSY
jgi:hypothetical protein